MKCPYCNAPITVEDEYCPYCGALNAQAKKHITDMKKYQQDYQRTKADVMKKANSHSHRYAQIIGVILLLFVNVVIIVCQFGMDEFRYSYQRFQARQHAAEHEAALSALEAAGDFASLDQYYSRKNIYGVHSLDHYSSVVGMAGNYSRCVEYIYYANHPEVRSYSVQSENIERIASNVKSFYDAYAYKDSAYNEERFSDIHLRSMEEMEYRMKAELKAYCNLTEEDLADLAELEKRDIERLIERGMGIYE